MNWETGLSPISTSIVLITVVALLLGLVTRRFVVYRDRHGGHEGGTEGIVSRLGRFIYGLGLTLGDLKRDVARQGLALDQARGELADRASGTLDLGTILSTLAFIANENRRLESRLQAAESQLQEQSRQLEKQWMEVRTDPLTGLANRRVFDLELSRRLREYRTHGTSFALALYDIDHFKQINDSGGHKTGDEILVHVARAMQSAAPEGALIARIGGEEFAALLPDRGLSETLALAERIRVGPGTAFDGAPALSTTLSCGVAVCQTSDTETSLFERADRALYAAKRSGRNAMFYDSGDRSVRYTKLGAGPTACVPGLHECSEDEAAIAWYDDPEARALVDVLRRKLSDLRILG
ncbi:MAG TPA: GGDEF domain-containing protein [Thermogutta sp.]|nr:GGDEF domain-containing protein [Thermogutta sp.]HOP77454.1 GGDEF domain-containing protein [Thermogutta sp.]HPU05229.1 GGDEF domain-containing protein [Thermogutta sp.]